MARLKKAVQCVRSAWIVAAFDGNDCISFPVALRGTGPVGGPSGGGPAVRKGAPEETGVLG
jgi:hypothetical protein